MGIKGLSKIINDSGNQKTISSFSGKKVAIDSSIFLYRYIYRAQTEEESVGCILKGFLEQLALLKKNNIKPIYIFDGYGTVHKRVLEDRKKRRESNTNKMETMKQLISEHRESIRSMSCTGDIESEGDIEYDKDSNDGDNIEDDIEDDKSDKDSNDIENVSDPVCLIVESDDETQAETLRDLTFKISNLQKSVQSLEKQNRKPTSEHLNVLKDMFDMLNVPYINSPGESDLVCAQLSKNDVVDLIFSDDTDMLPLGCSTLVTGFNTTKYNDLKEYTLESVLEHLGLSYSQFIDVCILSGCDYSEKIDQIAIKRAYQFIKKHQNIEGVIEYISNNKELKEKHTYSDDFEEQYQIARQMFSGEHPHIQELEEIDVTTLVSNSLDKVWSLDTDKEQLVDFLESHNTPEFSRVIKQFLAKDKKELPKNQPSILSFFMKK